MITKSMSLVCRRCKNPPEHDERKGRSNVIFCSRCGISANEKKVLEDARTYILESAGSAALDNLQSSIRSIASRSKNITYKPGKHPKIKAPDFIYI